MMDATRYSRLVQLMVEHPEVWHAGRTVELTMYKGWGGKEDYIGVMRDEELAELVVLSHELVLELMTQDKE